jgi:cytochrome c-type biogenesis protein CcmF
MQHVGTGLLHISLLTTLATAITAFCGARLRSPSLLVAARHGLVGSWLLFLAMGACLVHGLVTHDFANKYIAAYTDVDMPLAYVLSGFWGGEKGALLFWVTALATFSVWAVLRNRSQSQVFMGWVTNFAALAIAFFVVLMVFESNPFEVFASGPGPADGKGMNPLLQNPLMAVHPPSLLTGYIAFTLPYCFGLAALVTGQLDSQWLRDTRHWTLVSWLFLSLGLILGGAWAYAELGWGGFWMWDPVENAGLIPWFTATAFLHSVMIQERRNMLKRWNVVLVCLTFLLTIFGTFLTRSQLIDSVHAFADSTLASYFLWYMAGITVISIVAIAWRWNQLRAEAELDSLMSREAFFIFNNVLLVGCAFVVLWGTVFGQISEAQAVQTLHGWFADAMGKLGVAVDPLQGKVQLGEPWFNRVMTPLGLALLLMTGIGPLISWRRATRKNFEKNFRRPLVWASLGTFVVSAYWLVQAVRTAMVAGGVDAAAGWTQVVDSLDGSHVWGAVCVGFSLFVLLTIAYEFHAGARARQSAHGGSYLLALMLLTLRQKRRYGGYVVHVGVVFCFLAFAGTAFRTYQPEIALHPGESVQVGDYGLTYVGGDELWVADGAYVAQRATVVVVERDGGVPANVRTEIEASARNFDPRATVATKTGSPIVRVSFADTESARKFAARWQAPMLQRLARPIAGSPGGTVLDLELNDSVQQIAAVAPQVVMKAFAAVRMYAGDAPGTPKLATVPGQTRFSLTFQSVDDRQRYLDSMRTPVPADIRFAARVAGDDSKVVDLVPAGVGFPLVPEVRQYQKHQSPTTEVAIRSTIAHDLYLAMRPAQGSRSISLLAVVFPFIGLLWLGSITLLLGGAICLWPTSRTAVVAEPQPPPRGLKQPIAGAGPAPVPTLARSALDPG